MEFSKDPDTSNSILNSAEITIKPDFAEIPSKPDNAEISPKPDDAEITSKPDNAEITSKQDFAEIPSKPDNAEISFKLDDIVQNTFDGHRSLVADYNSTSSSDSDDSIDSEPDSSSESSKSNSSDGEIDHEVVEKVIRHVEEITITVPKDDAKIVGTIKYVVEDQVVIEPEVGLPALDIGTILFLDEGVRALGRIEDLIGPITEPFYCVNFSSAEDIKMKQIIPGMTVYYAPTTDHTTYVPLPTLMKQKGSDASWEHNEETPEEFKDFSDDDEENKSKQINKNYKQSQPRQNQPRRKNSRNWFERGGGRWRGSNRGNSLQHIGHRPPANFNYQRPAHPIRPRWMMTPSRFIPPTNSSHSEHYDFQTHPHPPRNPYYQHPSHQNNPHYRHPPHQSFHSNSSSGSGPMS